MKLGLRTLLAWLIGLWTMGSVGQAAALPQPAEAPPAPSLERSDVADATTQGLLLDGVRAFRAERYDEALQIFHRVKSQHLLQDIGFYEGMALHKLGRHAEALVAFRAAHRLGLREPIADYYQAVSCYRLGMMARAAREFAALLPQGSANPAPPVLGPRLVLGVSQFLRASSRGLPLSEVQASERLQAALASAELALMRSAPESLEWLQEAAELFPSVSIAPTYRSRFRQLLLRVRSATLPAGPAELNAPAPAIAAQVALELNLLWCRVADTPDCAL
jgi:tetratricopeptide (TPR) repeat protein